MSRATHSTALAATAPLAPTLPQLEDDPREGLRRCADMQFRHVQLSATQAGLRPRDLDRSGRRGLASMLNQLELTASGLDLWIPPAHFTDSAHVDRAAGAVLAAIELASDLGRLPLSLTLPVPAPEARKPDMAGAGSQLPSVMQAIAAAAQRYGVEIADHAAPMPGWPGIGVGIDPAACLANSIDPAAGIAQAGARLVSARLCDLDASGMRGPLAGTRTGRLDAQAFKVALSVVGYARPVVIDARQWTDPVAGIQQTAALWAALA